MAVTLQHVADLAGVSMKTVSNVVRDYPHVRPAMRTRVQAAIDELGYVPHTTARRLATGRTGMVALAIPAIGVPYFGELAEDLTGQLERLQYRLLIEQTSAGIEEERQVLRGREQGLVDGLIFQPTLLDAATLDQLRGRTPLVLLGEVTPPDSVDHVMVDNVAAANAATTHLIESGRRRIAFVGHERTYRHHTTNLRVLGYQQALQRGNQPTREELLIAASDFGAAAADQAVTAALEAGLEFDGLICYDDLTAIGAIRALIRGGRTIPDDVAVVGWDDISVARFVCPALTTVRPDKAALSARAVQMLHERIDGLEDPGRHEIVPFELVVRESSHG